MHGGVKKDFCKNEAQAGYRPNRADYNLCVQKDCSAKAGGTVFEPRPPRPGHRAEDLSFPGYERDNCSCRPYQKEFHP
jgi:hypothetical protein